MPKLYLLGTGIRGLLQITQETQQALSISDKIYVLHSDLGVIRNLEETFDAEVVDLEYIYRGVKTRNDAYKQIAQLIVGATSEATTVSFVVHGHPLFLVSASEYIYGLAERKSITVHALPSVTSLDTIMCDLQLDLGYALQIYDTTTLLRRNHQLDNRAEALFFQLTSTLNPNVIDQLGSDDTLAEFREYLLRFYPHDHPVKVVYSAATAFSGSIVQELELSKLSAQSLNLVERPTLYVPAIE
ncbi:SAM-dependent methyltransferase [Jonesia quinghaiensis]|uniref:SAM-dependent methyltransferase n=1 Tax=Jonesia quinghaiensis TaxID=262806 RepID=UPI0005698FA2|nr:SAM-dependent methyltransferase [Jonesia quinghaiensis]